jgi:amidohydrolase
MHACGHDANTAILLGTGMVLKRLGGWKGKVKLIFQPAEETLQGAKAMIEDGVLENPTVDVALGFHNWPPVETGKVAYHPEVAFGASNGFDITLKGVSGHAAHPQSAVDVITNAAYFITQLQTIVSREILPTSPAVVSIGQIHAGTARNIFPDVLHLEGTVRSHSTAVTAQIEAAIRRLLEGMKAGMRLDYDFDFQDGVPHLSNDQDVLASALASARHILGEDNVQEIPHGSMGGEDFAFFTQRVPSAHFRIGSKIEGFNTMVHRDDFQPNEGTIPVGARVMSRTAFDLLT